MMSAQARQIAAAVQVANANIASGGQPFYAELFGASGSPIWSGSFGASPPTASTAAAVASVSKSIYAIVAAQKMTLTATDYPYLTMTAGYDAMNGQQCQANGTETVHSCMTTVGIGGIAYNTKNPLHVGKFAYDSASWQYHADNIAGISADTRSALATLYRSTLNLGLTDLVFTQPLIAGGVTSPPSALRSICQQIMAGTLNIKALLQDANTPVNASTYFADGSVVGSPAPANQPWKYKWGFWVEPGGGYYWMSGSYGTSVWMSADFSMGGMVFRVADGTGGEMGVQSIAAGQAIRQAFLTGMNRFRKRIRFGFWAQ